MIAASEKVPLSFNEFIDWYPETSEINYELRRGVIVEMPKPKGKHSEITGFGIKKLNYAIDQMQVPYFIPRECIIKISDDTGYEPDIAVVDRAGLADESRWESSSIIESGKSVKLVVEVVSTNWRDDYPLKLSDYESIGIEEYWLGSPKAITATAHKLARIFYSLWRTGQGYVDPGVDYYEQKYQERLLTNLKKKADSLGFAVIPKPSTDSVS